MRPAGSPPPAPGARGPFLAFATAAALLLGGTAALGLYGRAHDAALQVGVVGLTAAALVASVLRARQPGPEALGWQIFSLSLLSNTLIQATRIPIFLGHPLPSYLPAISMVLQILGSLFLVGTLITWHLAPKTRFDRIRHGLDRGPFGSWRRQNLCGYDEFHRLQGTGQFAVRFHAAFSRRLLACTLARTARALIYLAMIKLMLRRLARP